MIFYLNGLYSIEYGGLDTVHNVFTPDNCSKTGSYKLIISK